MRPNVAAVLLLCLSAVLRADEQQSFPYKAYVLNDDVYVRSGPGEIYYPTGKLQSGDKIEVYRHDPGGWYAIRPPEGSFTWVSQRHLKLQENGLGVITEDRVAARVGSRFSDIRGVVQVRLDEGEVVEVLDCKAFAAGPDAGIWYKIAPPSGEFRWIFGKFVDRSPPDDSSGTVSTGNTSAPGAVAGEQSRGQDGTSRAGEPEVLEAQHVESVDTLGTGGGASDPAALAPVGSTDEKAEQVETSVSDPPAQGPARPNDSEQEGEASGTVGSVSPRPFQSEMDDVQLELAIMLAEEPTVWSFDELSLRAEALLTAAETAVERRRARLLVKRIAQVQDIKNRYDAIQSMDAAEPRQTCPSALVAPQRESQSQANTESTDRFDGTGRLARVVSPKVGAPRYALVDDTGDVRCFITPAPGINMQYYLGKRIGVNGIRGYIAEQQAQHVMAKHVTPLEAPRLR